MAETVSDLPKPSGQDFAKILNGLPLAVAYATLEENPRIVFINESFTRLFGYTLEDIPRVADWAARAYPDEAYRRETFRIWDAAVATALETRGAVESMEFQVVCKDGARKGVLISATVLEDRLLVSLVDITARRKAEAEARSAQEQLERTAYEVTENIPAGTYTMVLPPDGGMAKFSFMSTRFLELCGLERKAAEENPLNAFACVHPEDYDEWVRKNAECFEKKIPFSEECRVVANGTTRWIRAESLPRPLPDGSIVWEGVLSDITRRKTAEAELAASEARLRKILNNVPIPISFSEAVAGGRIVLINDSFTRIFGYTPEDLPDVGVWAHLAYPDEAYRTATFQAWDDAVAEAQRSGDPMRAMEFRVCAKDGTRRDVIISAAILDDLLLVGFVDITDRKLAEDHLARSLENLREATQRMQLAAEAAGIGFWIRDLESQKEEWDAQMLCIYGLRAEDFDGRWEPCIHPEDLERVQRETFQALESENHGQYEYRIIHPDGSVHFLRGVSTGVRDIEGKLIREIGVNYDITPQKEAEKALAEAREKERLSEEAQRQIIEKKLQTSLAASAVAHEINQPLSRILLTAQLALQEAEAPGNPKLFPFFKELAAEANRVVVTIAKMKSLLRNVESIHHPVDLVNVVEDALLYCKPLLKEHRVEIVFQPSAKTCEISGDAGQLQIALGNLIRNAAEAIAQSPTSTRRDILVEIRDRADAIEIAVADSGPGLAETEAKELLLKSTKPEGSGMGLYLVHTTMENHGGRLEIGPSPLGGAEFHMVFPRERKEFKF